MGRRIAVVEDEPAILANYVDHLRRCGYTVEGYKSRGDAWADFRLRLPELVIIDVGLGVEIEGGFDLCRELRSKSSSLPIIFLTARDNDMDVISGLRLGADDYLIKDISLPHLVARIAALFRRIEALSQPVEGDRILRRGQLMLDPERMDVAWKGHGISLTVTEFWMLHALVRYQGHVKTRDQLMREAKAAVDEPAISSHVKRIRKKFVAIDASFDAIETVYGAGYRWRPSP
jgi:two-component system, OmpR family, response regulator